MPINTTELETAIRKVLEISHLEIIDQSSGCGDNYAVLLVSNVCLKTMYPGSSNLMYL